MKKVLFILGAYFPNYSANGICCKNVIDELVNKGYDVDCIVNSTPQCKKKLNLDGATVHPVKPRLYIRLSNILINKKSKLLSFFASFINKLSLFFSFFTWPLVSRLTTYRFYRKAVNLNKEKNYDVVIAVYTPMESLYAGYLLKRKYSNILFVPYFLDALAGGWGPKKWSTKKINRRTQKWENKILKMADYVFSMKSSMNYHLKNTNSFFDSKRRFYLNVPMYLGEKNSYNKKSIKTIIYGGNLIFPNRNPIYMLDVFTQLSQLLDIEIFFIGSTNILNVFEKYENMTNGKIKYLGSLSHDELLKTYENADCFLNLGSDNPNTIPCKIFEYMYYQKPIISTYKILNEPSIVYLEKYKNYCLIDENALIEESAEKLFSYISNYNKFIDYDKNDFYESSPHAFEEKLRHILGEKNER